jgi:hypothetical protein
MEYRENQLTYDEYISLRSAAGWDNFSEAQVSKGVNAYST